MLSLKIILGNPVRVAHVEKPVRPLPQLVAISPPGCPPKLVTLVCSKASAIDADFVLLVAPTSYDRLWRDVLEVVGWREEPFWLSKIVQVRTGPCLCDGNHIDLVVDFFRRIALPT